MATKKEATKPLFPLLHEFRASLEAFTQQAGMLADTVETIIGHGAVDKRVVDVLRERLDAFNVARYGKQDKP